MKKNTLARTMRLAQLAMLIAIQAILTFTPLGFIMIPPISITIMHIPVIIGAVTMGPLFGGILGASFGVMSMLKATFAAASPADIIFSPLYQWNAGAVADSVRRAAHPARCDRRMAVYRPEEAH